jgi:hypothetical protein
MFHKIEAGERMVLHPKQNIQSKLKWQTCFGTVPTAKQI